MSNTPKDLKYTASHEWVRDEGNGTVTIGVTDHAQQLLGDVVFVELPDIDKQLATGQECGVVESVKAAADVYSPITGVVIEVNHALNASPDLINKDPYGQGWLCKLRVEDSAGLNDLLSADTYEQTLDH